jgi:hypothetical protein
MVPGYVQGMSRVPPDHPERGAVEELYSGGLWGKAEVQSLKSKVQSRRAETRIGPGQGGSLASRSKPPQRHFNATSKPPQCVLIANR